MTTTSQGAGRPPIKPKRKPTGFHINIAYIDKMQQVQLHRKESLNDLYNEAVRDFLIKEGIKPWANRK